MKKFLSFLFVFAFLVLLTGCGDKIHTVEFIVDGEVIKTEEVNHKQNATAPENPFKEGYDFIEWDQDFSIIKKDLKVNAVFEIQKFTVSFFDLDGELLKEEIVEYGNPATAPDAPVVEGKKFTGWDKPIDNITSDLDVNAVYDLLKHKVVFYDKDNNVVKEMDVAHGKSAFASAPFVKGYRFTGWDKPLKNITTDLEVHPIYELDTFEIKYYDGSTRLEGLTPTSYTVEDGTSIDLPKGPEKEGYEFIGWFDGNERVVTFFTADAENKTFNAKYKELPKPLQIPSDCSFMFKNIKKIPHSTNPGVFVYQPDFSGLDVEGGVTNYNWSSLHEDVAKISQWSSISVVNSGYAIIRAENKNDKTIVGYAVIKVNADGVFISSIEEATNPTMYTVEFHDENGKVIKSEQVEEYKAATLPEAPLKEGYTFVGWSGEHFNIKENITLEPVYKKGVSDYAHKTVSILGDSITTYSGYIPEGYATFYPYPTADVKDVNQTWWMRVINNLGMKLLKNNSYAGSCVSTGTGSSAATNDARLKELLGGGKVAPDIILIYMGANDCASSSVSLNTFKDSYKLMIEKIQKLCPKSELYIINLPKSHMYTDENRSKYNNVMKDYADMFKLPLLDISNIFDDTNLNSSLVDSIHPNKQGMTLMSDKLISDLLKLKGIVNE